MGMEINTNRLQQADAAANANRQEGVRGEVRENDRNDFEKAMNRDQGQQGAGIKEASTPQQPSPSSLFESMFGHMNQVGQGTQNMQNVQGTQSMSQTAEIDSLVDKLVDRILTNQPGVGDPKVSLSIGSGPLAGSELSITRAVDGQLAVQINCAEANAYATAREAMDNLRTALERTGENNVRVDVNQDSGSRDEGNTDRRSRGLENESYY